MTALLELKQRIKNLYSQYEIYILPVLRFVLAMVYFISYSGNKKVMKQFEKISKDLYIYYGVSEDDIKKKTERYLSLVTALSS